ncbi:hypothetical protein Tco_0312220 [Tanacetum coccineum]
MQSRNEIDRVSPRQKCNYGFHLAKRKRQYLNLYRKQTQTQNAVKLDKRSDHKKSQDLCPFYDKVLGIMGLAAVGLAELRRCWHRQSSA